LGRKKQDGERKAPKGILETKSKFRQIDEGADRGTTGHPIGKRNTSVNFLREIKRA